MKKTIQTSLALSFAFVVSMRVAPAIPAPPPSQQTTVERHHVLYGGVIPGPTDAPQGIPGEPYVCLSCHAIDTGSGTNQFIVERDCRACHNPDRHHHLYGSVVPYRTEAPYSAAGDLYVCLSCHTMDTDLGAIRFPVERDCQACHDARGIRNVIVDIRPRLNPNLINPKGKGLLTVVILGSEDYNVSEIDVSSLLIENQVSPLWARLMSKNGRAHPDLMLRFSSKALWNVLGDLQPCQTRELWITGAFKNGTQLRGSDSVLAMPCRMPH